MSISPKPAANKVRRCRLVTGFLLLVLLAITLGLWRASIIFLNFRQQEASRQDARQAIGQLMSSIENRMVALRQVSHFLAHSEAVQERQFQDFCASIMNDVPGMLAIVRADVGGNPGWVAPRNALPMSSIYIMTADPQLRKAMDRSLTAREPILTETVTVPEHGAGFMAAVSIEVARRPEGFIVGIFHYQMLINSLMQPDMWTRYNVRIFHTRWPVFPLASTGMQFLAKFAFEPAIAPYGVREKVSLGGQEWDIHIEPLKVAPTSPLNFVSLTILGLGLSLSLLLTWLVHRWQWQAIVFQTAAHDSQTRLERTGLNLVEVKSELDLILNSVDEGVILYNSQLEPVQANAAFLLAFGLAESDAATTSSHEHHEHLIQQIGSETKYWMLFNSLRHNPEQSYMDEVEARPAGGNGDQQRVFLRRATNTCGADGEPRGVMVVYKDVTKMKKMDKVKDEFLSNVTHELRSPLASIKGFAETIRRDPKMPPETREEFMTIICDEASRLQELIEELLDLRRLEASGAGFTPAPYDFKMLVENVMRGVRSVLLSKNITIRVHWSGRHNSRHVGDVAQLTRALRNLLVNAIKYSPSGGEVAITGHCGQRRLWLEITDQGSGISEKDLPHIFDKFYRGERQGRQKGTGLGLAIVKHIVEQHGGHLGVRSEVGNGTTFRVELPRQPEGPGSGPSTADDTGGTDEKRTQTDPTDPAAAESAHS